MKLNQSYLRYVVCLIAAALIAIVGMSATGHKAFQKVEIFENSYGERVAITPQGFSCLWNITSNNSYMTKGEELQERAKCIDAYGYSPKPNIYDWLIFALYTGIAFALCLWAYRYASFVASRITLKIKPNSKPRKIAFVCMLLIGIPTILQFLIFDTVGQLTTLLASISGVLALFSFSPLLDWASKNS